MQCLNVWSHDLGWYGRSSRVIQSSSSSSDCHLNSSGVVVEVPVLTLRPGLRVRVRFALQALDLRDVRWRAGRGSLLKEVGHVSDLEEMETIREMDAARF